MEVKAYYQTTCESCLPVCLLVLKQAITGQKFNHKDEIDLLMRGLLAAHRDYPIGMLIAFLKREKLKVRLWVRGEANKEYFCQLLPDEVEVLEAVISTRLIDKMLKNGKPLIILVDGFYFGIAGHWTHFVLINKDLGQSYEIFNSWTGKKENTPKRLVAQSLSRAWNKLLFATMIIEPV